MEASASRKPIISGKSGGSAEAVLDGQTGFLVNSNDDEQVIKRIQDMLTDKSLRVKLGTQGRERALKEFSWKQRSQELIELLNRTA